MKNAHQESKGDIFVAEKIEYSQVDKYFAASNSARGFKNYFSDIFAARDLGRLYILKGGPGTGKSRFMKEVAEAAEKGGFAVDHFYCSSDPDSLDGIIIGDGLCAIVDGTPPHSVDPSYPGSVDEIINLGEFWDESALLPHRDKIIALCDQKSRAYREAYRFLEASNLVSSEIRREVYECVNIPKLRAAVSRIFARIPDGEGFEKKTRIVNSVGMKGEVGFDTFAKKAKKHYYILDHAESAYIIFAHIYKKALEKKLPVHCSYSPVEPDIIDALYFPTLFVSFTVTDERRALGENEKTINMARFVDKDKFAEIKGRVKFSARCRDALLDEAKERLQRVRETHFELEEIYIAAMDFDAKEKATKEWTNKIIGYCEKYKNMVE